MYYNIILKIKLRSIALYFLDVINTHLKAVVYDHLNCTYISVYADFEMIELHFQFVVDI